MSLGWHSRIEIANTWAQPLFYMLNPLHDNLIVEALAPKESTISGIIIPDTAHGENRNKEKLWQLVLVNFWKMDSAHQCQ